MVGARGLAGDVHRHDKIWRVPHEIPNGRTPDITPHFFSLFFPSCVSPEVVAVCWLLFVVVVVVAAAAAAAAFSAVRLLWPCCCCYRALLEGAVAPSCGRMLDMG